MLTACFGDLRPENVMEEIAEAVRKLQKYKNQAASVQTSVICLIFNTKKLMKLIVSDHKTGGDLLLISGEENFDRFFYTRDKAKKYFTIAWNTGASQTINIDGADHVFNANTLLPLMFDQTFTFERSADIIAWQFNREFYCLIDHDTEVSCVGFLFGMGDLLFIPLDDPSQSKLKVLLDIFTQELHIKDKIQNDMLIMLLKRLIIMVTQMARTEYIPAENNQDQKLDIFRKFNLLVEMNFKSEHSVNFYAGLMNKSPKTLSNIFSLYNDKTPQQVIQSRIIVEARRLLNYTTKSVKQITYELGFEDPAYFCNFFKRHTKQSPAEFRSEKVQSVLQ